MRVVKSKKEIFESLKNKMFAILKKMMLEEVFLNKQGTNNQKISKFKF